MPKIMEGLRERLLAETRRQVETGGYRALTVRSVATGCGIGVGTVYNYFPSKEALMAACMAEDWQRGLASIGAAAADAAGPEPVLRASYDALCVFVREHERIFLDAQETAGLPAAFRRYHALLRSQLAEPLRSFCAEAFTAEFAAEALLTWTMAGREFEEIFRPLQKLFD